MTPERWQQVKGVLQEALELGAEQRPAFLDRECGADAELRCEVESLLSSHRQLGSGFLGQPINSLSGNAGASSTPADERRMGAYQLLEKIGHGGMGEVYRAVRVDGQYHKEVAIKLIRSGLESSSLVERFCNERQILALLDHPNIARLLDGGATREGVPYLVMDLIEGVSIDRYCDDHELSITQRLQLFRQVCEAVQYAHQQLVIHRDIKPSNILVSDVGAPKLLDFGIAKLLDAAGSTGSTLARPMTPEYASPEQIRGGSITAATDVYSLGVVLYQLLAGRLPYTRDTSTPHELARAICEEDPLRPSTVILGGEEDERRDPSTPERITNARENSPTKLHRRLRGDLDNIVLTALRKEPSDRYRSVERFSEDIRRHLEHIPVLASKGTLRYRASKLIRRHRTPVAASAVVSVLVIVGAFLGFDLGQSRHREPASSGALMTLTPFMNMAGEVSYPAFAPDGKQLAFAWATPQVPNNAIYLKAVGGEAPLRLTYSKDGEDSSPTWSADGTQIAFSRTSAKEVGIFVVPVRGGPARKLLALRPDRYYNLKWSPDGQSIAFAERASADEPYCIFLLSLENGKKRQITFPPKNSFGEVRFDFSPDLKMLAFVRRFQREIVVEVMPISGGSEPRRLASYTEWIGDLAWSSDGQSLILTGNRQGVRRLWRVDVSDGREAAIPEVGEDTFFPAVSRKGNYLAFVRQTMDSDLWRTELSSPHGPGKPPVRVISSTRVEGAPRFSPDGKRIAFQSYRTGAPEIWLSDPDGSNAIQLTNVRVGNLEMPAWSPDGRTIAFAGAPFQLISASGEQPRRLLDRPELFLGPSWSRDGERIYFWNISFGEDTQIWEIPSKGGSPVQITKNGGLSSMESPDGKFLYFTKANAPGVWKIPVGGGDETLMMNRLSPEFPGYWSVFGDGIYYLAGSAKPEGEIDFYSFATRQSSRILGLAGQPDPWFGGLTVSPDRRWIVFSQREYSSSELILVENFR